MRRAKGSPIVLALLILTGNLAWAAPITVLNPSFEAQSLAIRGFTPGVLTDWNVPGDQGAFRPSAFEFNGGNPQGLQTDPAVGIPDGVNVAYSNGGTISQVLGDTLTAGLLYTLTLDVGSRLDFPSPGYVIQLLAGGDVLASTSAPTPVIGQFVTTTVSFLAPANHPDLGTPLEIRLLTGGQQNDFDNVRLDASLANGNPVPEPSTFILLGTGLVGFLGYGWRRRKYTVNATQQSSRKIHLAAVGGGIA